MQEDIYGVTDAELINEIYSMAFAILTLHLDPASHHYLIRLRSAAEELKRRSAAKEI